MSSGLSYTYSHWAFDIVAYLIYNLGGFAGIYIAVVVLACIINITLFTLIYKRSNSIIPAFITVMLTIYFVQNAYTARSQIVSFLCFIIEIYCIEKFIETNQKKYAVTIIILAIVVANFHAATWPLTLVLFLPYIACALLNQITFKKMYARKIKKLEKQIVHLSNGTKEYEECEKELEYYKQSLAEDRKPLYSKMVRRKSYNGRNLAILLIIVALTGLITPIHGTPYTYVYKSMFGESNLDNGELATDYVEEMRPVIPVGNIAFLGFTIIFIGFLAFMPTKLKTEHGILILGLYLMSISSDRYTYILTFLGAYVVCDLMSQSVKKLMNDDLISLENMFCKKKPAIVLVCLTCILSGLFGVKKFNQDYVDEGAYPVETTVYIKENLDYENIRIFNSYNFGSYLMLNDIPVFIDSRLDVYCSEFNDTEVFRDYVYTYYGYIYYEDTFTKYDFTHILLYQDEPLNSYVSKDENYSVLYEDEYFVLYERNVD